MKKIKLLSFIIFAFALNSCGIYNFTGTSGNIDSKSFQVNRFQNSAPLIEPGIDRLFTIKLQEVIQNQTNLSLTDKGGDLVYEGEITDYNISPTNATANITAAQSRLTVSVNIRFVNKKKEADNFEKKFSHFSDYSGQSLPKGEVLNKALEEIFTRITQDIFNESLAKW